MYQETAETLDELNSIMPFFKFILDTVYNHTNNKKNE
jgi:hypothetical protein